MATAAVGSTGTGWSAAEWGTRVRRWLAVLPLAGLCAGLLAQALGRPDFATAAGRSQPWRVLASS